MRVTVLHLSTASLLPAACLLCGTPGAQAQIDKRCFTNGNGTRCYYLHVPPGATAGKPGRTNPAQWLAADNLADPGSAPPQTC